MRHRKSNVSLQRAPHTLAHFSCRTFLHSRKPAVIHRDLKARIMRTGTGQGQQTPTTLRCRQRTSSLATGSAPSWPIVRSRALAATCNTNSSVSWCVQDGSRLHDDQRGLDVLAGTHPPSPRASSAFINHPSTFPQRQAPEMVPPSNAFSHTSPNVDNTNLQLLGEHYTEKGESVNKCANGKVPLSHYYTIHPAW